MALRCCVLAEERPPTGPARAKIRAEVGVEMRSIGAALLSAREYLDDVA
jgi:hypothetical protein